jgi:hypothetical protein
MPWVLRVLWGVRRCSEALEALNHQQLGNEEGGSGATALAPPILLRLSLLL